MSMVGSSDLNDILDMLLMRVYDVEQALTDPLLIGQSSGGNQFNTILLGPGGGTQVILQVPVSPPTAVVVTPGAYQTNIFLDFSWTAPSDASASEYEIHLARKLGGVYQVETAQRVQGNVTRFNNLLPNTTYGWKIQALNPVGMGSAWVPATSYTDVTTGVDATLPAQVTGVAATPIPKGFVVVWNPVADIDVINGGMYRVEVSTNNTFTAIVKTYNTVGLVASVVDLTSATTYYVRVTAIDASANAGTPSATVTATSSQIATGDIAANAVTATQIAANTITAAQIFAGSITGDRLTAGTVSAAVLMTSSLTSQTITISGTGSFKIGSPPGGTGLSMDASGVHLYNGGTLTVDLNATTGAASFTGNITATGGSITGNMSVTGTLTGGIITGAMIRIGGGTPYGTIIDTRGIQLDSPVAYDTTRAIRFVSSLSGNLLTPNQASVETSAVGFAAKTNCAIARTTAQAADGTASLQLTATAAGAVEATTTTGTGGTVIQPSQVYSAILSTRGNTVARNASVAIFYYQASGAASAIKASDYGTAAINTTTGWTQVSVTALTPADAAFASVVVNIAGLGAGEIQYVDKLALFQGTVTSWASPPVEQFHIFSQSSSNVLNIESAQGNGGSFVFSGNAFQIRQSDYSTIYVDIQTGATRFLQNTVYIGASSSTTAKLQCTNFFSLDAVSNMLFKNDIEVDSRGYFGITGQGKVTCTTWDHDGTGVYGEVSHSSIVGGSDYGYISSSSGDSFVNCVNGRYVYMYCATAAVAMASYRASGGTGEIIFQIPNLGGMMNMGWHPTSHQLGWISSSEDTKKNIRKSLPKASSGKNNPVFKMGLHTFDYVASAAACKQPAWVDAHYRDEMRCDTCRDFRDRKVPPDKRTPHDTHEQPEAWHKMKAHKCTSEDNCGCMNNVGFMADELALLNPKLVHKDHVSKKVTGVNDQALIAFLVDAVQDLNQRILDLEAA